MGCAGYTLIADSGSTKTAWAVVEGNKLVRNVMTEGINPYQQTEEEICAVLHGSLCEQLGTMADAIAEIFFYGAGCTPEKSEMVKAALRRTVSVNARIFVGSDMLGAARGLCGHEEGLVCILGTGSNSCYYNGRELGVNVSPLGFILGDEGSGAYIGKRLVGDCLKNQMPQHIVSLFMEETKLTAAEIINKVYRQPLPNRFLASLSPFCARHRDLPEIHDFLIDCFTQFFIRNIRNYERPELKVHFVGSIAWFYRAELTEAAERLGYRVGVIMHEPINALVDYHSA